jgi:hypothetical protein
MEKLRWLTVVTIIITISPSSTFTIHCDYGSTSFGFNYGAHGPFFTCFTNNAWLSSDQTATNVTGINYGGNETNDDVQAISIDGKGTLSFIPRGLLKFFPNLIVVTVESAAFDTLHGDDLIEIGEKLQYFGVYHSSITTISSRLFEHTPNVVYVAMSGNEKLQRVGRDLFASLNVQQLEILWFGYNLCISKNAENHTEIGALIDDLKVSCPYDDESADVVRELEDKVDKLQWELTSTRDEMQHQLDQANKKIEAAENELAATKVTINEMKDELQWLRNELLKHAAKQ